MHAYTDVANLKLILKILITAQQLSLMLLGTSNIGEGTPIMTYSQNRRSARFPLESQGWETNQGNAQVVCRQLGFGGLYT